MFTQHPITTEKNWNVEICTYLLKKKNWKGSEYFPYPLYIASVFVSRM